MKYIKIFLLCLGAIINLAYAADHGGASEPIADIVKEWAQKHQKFHQTLKHVYFDSEEIKLEMAKEGCSSALYTDHHKKEKVDSLLAFIEKNYLHIASSEILYDTDALSFVEKEYREKSVCMKNGLDNDQYRKGYYVPKDNFSWTLDAPLVKLSKSDFVLSLPYQASTRGLVTVAPSASSIAGSLKKDLRMLENIVIKPGHKTEVSYDFKVKVVEKKFNLVLKLEGYFAAVYASKKGDKLKLFPITAVFHKNNHRGFSVAKNKLTMTTAGKFEGRYVAEKKTTWKHEIMSEEEAKNQTYSITSKSGHYADWEHATNPHNHSSSESGTMTDCFRLTKL